VSGIPGPVPGATATLATLARIPYLNAAPFYVRWAEAPGATVDLPPRALGEGARAGHVDAGLMAAADWFGLDPGFEIVGPYGITCRGAVSSVLLLARRPFAELFAPGAGPRTVDLTTESQTSVALTRILLADRFGARDVAYVRRAVEADAAPTGDAWLLIGDAALRARAAAASDPSLHILDLGAEWLAWTGLPFVYAVWTVRASLPAGEKARLAAFLETSLAAGERDLDGLAAAAAAADPSTGLRRLSAAASACRSVVKSWSIESDVVSDATAMMSAGDIFLSM
jgi:chorismate dehydratase